MRRLVCLFVALQVSVIAGGASLQQRIDAAQLGHVIRVPAGRHTGPLQVNKPLTLLGEEGAVIVGDGKVSVITINADDVRIENLHITGSGMNLDKDHAGIFVHGKRAIIRSNRIDHSLHGIYLKEAGDCEVSGNTIVGQPIVPAPIDDVVTTGLRADATGICSSVTSENQRGNGIHLWNSSGNRIEGNHISDTRDGIYFSFSHETSVVNNTILRARYGLHYMYSDNNVFERNRFEESAAGAAIMYSEGLLVRGNTFANNGGHRAYGLLMQSVDGTTLMANDIERNTVGLYLENSNGNRLLGNRVQRNYVGVRLSSSSAGNSVSGTRFLANMHPVEMDQDSRGNEWAINGRGNYWQGGQPVDIDADGVGDLPHRESDPLGLYRRSFPLAGLLTESPFLRLLGFVNSRSRVPGLPAVEDPAPLVSRKEAK